MATGEVVISRRFGSDPRRWQASGIRAAKEVSRAGTMSFLTPVAALAAEGFPDFKGMWVHYEHDSGFTFAGVITARRRRPGAWEIIAETFHVLMRKRRMARLFRTLTAPPGSLFVRVLKDAQNGDPLGLRSILADESGDAMRLDARAMDLYDEVIPTLLRGGEFEWDIDDDRNASFGKHIGADRRATVHLAEGRHVVDFSLDDDLWTITNDILGIPARRGFAESRAFQVEDGDSIRGYGRMQGTLVVPEITKHAITPVIKRQLQEWKDPRQSLSLTLANEDNCFGWFGIGDRIRVTLGSAGTTVIYRPLAIALDEDTGTMTTAGEVVEVVA